MLDYLVLNRKKINNSPSILCFFQLGSAPFPPLFPVEHVMNRNHAFLFVPKHNSGNTSSYLHFSGKPPLSLPAKILLE